MPIQMIESAIAEGLKNLNMLLGVVDRTLQKTIQALPKLEQTHRDLTKKYLTSIKIQWATLKRDLENL